MTEQQLREIEARCEVATRGPWHYDGMHNEIAAPKTDEYFLIISELREHPGEELLDEFGHTYNADFAFIAHSRQDIPALLAEVRRLQRECDAALGDLKAVLTEGGYGCDYCKYEKDQPVCAKTCSSKTKLGGFEWRGPDGNVK